jgi:hypothetical protein
MNEFHRSRDARVPAWNGDGYFECVPEACNVTRIEPGVP